MSTGLNSMAGVVYEDVIKPRLRRPLSQNAASRIIKLIVVIIGSICVTMVLVVEKISSIIQVQYPTSKYLYTVKWYNFGPE